MHSIQIIFNDANIAVLMIGEHHGNVWIEEADIEDFEAWLHEEYYGR